MSVCRYDIVSDTHGHISDALLAELKGADVIIHAGDICSPADWRLLSAMGPLWMCLGNNDFAGDYAFQVKKKASFYGSGLRWQLCHYRQQLDIYGFDICVCGHTHKPYIEQIPGGALVINPGSPTWPRRSEPSFARVLCENNRVISAAIITL